MGGQGVELQPFLHRLLRGHIPIDFISWHQVYEISARLRELECGDEVRSMLPPDVEVGL